MSHRYPSGPPTSDDLYDLAVEAATQGDGRAYRRILEHLRPRLLGLTHDVHEFAHRLFDGRACRVDITQKDLVSEGVVAVVAWIDEGRFDRSEPFAIAACRYAKWGYWRPGPSKEDSCALVGGMIPLIRKAADGDNGSADSYC